MPRPLGGRVDVEVVEPHHVRQRLEDDEADASAVDDDVLRVLGREAGGQALARALRVVAAQALQALAHRAQAQREQGLEVAALAPSSANRGGRRLVHPCALRMCSSTSFALAGIGVPGP